MKHHDAKTFIARNSIVGLVRLAHSMMHEDFLAELAQHDLNFMHWMVLMQLRECADGLTSTTREH